MEAKQLRHRIWELRINLREERIATKIGEGGNDVVNELSQMLENIEAKLGVAEYKLQVPGGMLNNDFRKKVIHGVSSLDSFFTESKANQTKEGAKNVLKALQLINMIEPEMPLVLEEEKSTIDTNKQKIVRMLTESDCMDELLVIPIIGMPGTGKTTLTQRVYHDKLVSEYFAVRHWVSMSDFHDGPTQILNLVYRHKTSDAVILEKFHSIVDGKRYLLILDGVAQGDHGLFLHKLLCNVSQGSKVIITALNMAILGNIEPLRLAKGAPYEMAYLSGDGSQSYIQRKYKILPVEIQQCVNYCSLFPENQEFSKADLLHFWDAQEYLSAEDSTETYVREVRPKELVGDEYFRELQNKGLLLQGNNEDEMDKFKLDPLVTELLKSVARPEFLCVDDDGAEDIDTATVLHLSFHVTDSTWEAPSWLPDAKQLKSLIFFPSKLATNGIFPQINQVLSYLRQLQALDLTAINCESLSHSLGELTELRYLRLGVSSEYLPHSISKLTNLKTLDLRRSSVTVLPREITNLVGLKHLYTGDRLIDLPPSFKRLTSLQTLDVYIVGENTIVELCMLEALVGKLKVRYDIQHEYGNDNQALKISDGLLKNLFLTDLSLTWSSSYGEVSTEYCECLPPPPSLRSLALYHWKGVRFPQQLTNGFPFLGRLVSLHIEDCSRCEYLPTFSNLPHLRSLQLWDLMELKHIETGYDKDTTCTTDFFPSLEFLMLADLPKLKAWSPEDGKHHIFPSLVEFRISGCPMLRSMPQMKRIESIEAHYVNGVLLEHILSSQESSAMVSTLKTLVMVSVHKLNTLSINMGLESLTIRRCLELRKVTVESSLLKNLEVHECGELKEIATGSLMHLMALEKLEIKHCEALGWWDINKDGDDELTNDSLGGCEAWEKLKSLCSLKLIKNSKLESLPRGLCFLRKLEGLTLHFLPNLRSIPEWIGNFTQLHRLAIRHCPLLTTLPESLARLSSLEEIEIRNCPRLKDIPESDLKSLRRLDIQGCPKLSTK